MKTLKIHRTGLIMLTALILTIGQGCGKDNPVDELIPYVFVNFTINVTGVNYNNLNIPGNWTYVTGGYRGIIIYHVIGDEYKAFERTSPVDFPNDFNCRVSVDESGLIAVDKCSESKFILLDGSPYEGPATLPLKQYRTRLDGQYLHVFN